ncbi:MAG: hypothetical protein M3280_04010 [Actinomycetota bacterium]|nr:hypothetical protein [Actinomycetota bacterium]
MFCVGCGRSTTECDGSCRRPLDPPRFCSRCGRRLLVQITPAGYSATCRTHGEVEFESENPPTSPEDAV